jgi:hypothetical protein
MLEHYFFATYAFCRLQLKAAPAKAEAALCSRRGALNPRGPIERGLAANDLNFCLEQTTRAQSMCITRVE